MAKKAKKSKKSSGPTSLKFLKSSNKAVRGHLAASVELPTFLATAGGLTLAERRTLVSQALLLMEQNFVHLPLKRAMHGIDPIQKLKLIQHRLMAATEAEMGPEFAFHREMLDVFTSVRDLHTNYMLPAPFAGRIAFLPFDIEEYFDDNGTPHYLASHFVQGFSHNRFRPGVEITTWNGVPIARAVEVSANLHAGSNLDARHARGVDGLTIRSLGSSMPPDAMWVEIGYVDLNGDNREMRQDWIVSPGLPSVSGVNPDVATEAAASLGLDIEADAIQRGRMMLFAPQAVAAEAKSKKLTKKRASSGADVPTAMSGVFRAQSVTTASGEFGLIRIFTFNVDDPAEFIAEFIRLANLLPRNGLIVDVRGNGGGHIFASEGLLQTLTPGEITPEPTQFINTPLNAEICARHEGNPVGIELGPWVQSIKDSVETGAIYSRGFPITPPGFANAWGQHYHGPCVLITDARCYSATDIFAAGFQDHNIGPILGVDGNTGAGGANVWTHGLLTQLMDLPFPPDPDTPYEDLPDGADMRVAIRRTLRVGEHSGTPLEDLGVKPDHAHAMTRDDLLSGNVDLLGRAGEILAAAPARQFEVSASRSGSEVTLDIETEGVRRLDIYVDGRPSGSADIGDGANEITVNSPIGAMLRIEGFAAEGLVASRNLNM